MFFLISCANFYFESNYPIHYAESSINKRLKDKDLKFLKNVSRGSQRTFDYMSHSTHIQITSKNYDSSTGISYLSDLSGVPAPSALIMMSKQHVGLTGVIVKYKVDQVYISE